MTDLEDDSSIADRVVVSKQAVLELQRQVLGVHNLHLYLHDKELELKKERLKAKRLEENLINTHKLLGERTLKNSITMDSISQTNGDQPSSLNKDSNNFGNMPDFDNLFSGKLDSSLESIVETDGEILSSTSSNVLSTSTGPMVRPDGEIAHRSPSLISRSSNLVSRPHTEISSRSANCEFKSPDLVGRSDIEVTGRSTNSDGDIRYQSSSLTSRSAGQSHIVEGSPRTDAEKTNLKENSNKHENENVFVFEDERKNDVRNETQGKAENGTQVISPEIEEGSNSDNKRCISHDFQITEDKMIQFGVTEQYFNYLVKELKMTKSLLNDLLQKNDIQIKDAVKWKQNKDQQTQIRHLISEKEKIARECQESQSDLEKVYKELCVFKAILRKEKEGETVHHHDHIAEAHQTSKSIENESDSSGSTIVHSRGPGSKEEKVTDKLSSPFDTCQSSGEEKTDEDKLKAEVRRLQDELNQQKQCFGMAMNECLRIKQEKDDVTENYSQLLSSLEELRKQKDDAYLTKQNTKLVEENFILKKELKSVQEDNLDYLANIENLHNNLSKEVETTSKLERALNQEQDSHRHTKHELHSMYSELRRKYNEVFHEKSLLQQQLLEMESRSTVYQMPQTSYESGSRTGQMSQRSFNLEITSLPVLSDTQSDKLGVLDAIHRRRSQPVESENVHSSIGNTEGGTQCFVCERCYAEFSDETNFLSHLQKCLD